MRFDVKKRFVLAAATMAALVVSSVAIAGGGVAGTYTARIDKPAQLKGKWGLRLDNRGTYTVTLNGQTLARGTYSATAKTITFGRERGGSECTGPGTYAWTRSGKTLTFVRKRETASCQGRAAVLAHRFIQVRS
jgi:hypothetical protein